MAVLIFTSAMHNIHKSMFVVSFHSIEQYVYVYQSNSIIPRVKKQNQSRNSHQISNEFVWILSNSLDFIRFIPYDFYARVESALNSKHKANPFNRIKHVPEYSMLTFVSHL